MIKNIKSIRNLAVFQNFDWKSSVRSTSGSVENFRDINIIYGRNYSGKTTLSRIMRAIEVGYLSDKYGSPYFTVQFKNNSEVTESELTGHNKKIRVFNEDFIRDNLRFIAHPNESIEPFAILGDDNNKIEKEIETLELELGIEESGKETGLYAQRAQARKAYSDCKTALQTTKIELDKLLQNKAIANPTGIKYQSERFGDQNYTIAKLKSDINTVLQQTYSPPAQEQLSNFEQLIKAEDLSSIPAISIPKLQLQDFNNNALTLIQKDISSSNKIDELVKNAILNQWVDKGREHHKSGDNCAFCGNPIKPNRWNELEKHFDKESDQLKQSINQAVQHIKSEKERISKLSINKELFYFKFHERLDLLIQQFGLAVDKYNSSLDNLTTQLETRKNDVLNTQTFKNVENHSEDLLQYFHEYNVIREESNAFTTGPLAKLIAEA